jgi:hypothetical protein
MRRTTDNSQLPQDTQRKLAKEEKIKSRRDRLSGLLASQITDEDVLAYAKEKMIENEGIEDDR